jgi:hypothetical protein
VSHVAPPVALVADVVLEEDTVLSGRLGTPGELDQEARVAALTARR